MMLGEFPVVMDLVGSVEAAKEAKQQVVIMVVMMVMMVVTMVMMVMMVMAMMAMACMQGAAREVCILPKKAGEAGALALLWKKGRDLPENVYFYILMPHFYWKVCRAQLEIRNCVRIISACNTLTQKKDC